ncbi:MAG: phosphatidate cytidylyltransferase [Erysipelotrichia bacterium]|nr:phosphatidate cytidylyltransferase [Erysipelotrichia bacterium]
MPANSTFLLGKYFVVLGMSVITIMALPVFFKQLTSRDSFIICAVFVLFYTFATSFMAIHNYNSYLVWFVIIATYACDTGAYFAGYFFGKHKLCERISPKKTIEGSIGGILFSIILSSIFAFFMLKKVPLVLLISAIFTMPIISQIGDLAFSAIKRNYNIKDFSNIFPGHGGFMDRIDSLVYNLVFFYALMIIFV